MLFGNGNNRYEVEENWLQLTDEWNWGWIPAVACDSKDNVYIYSRSDRPLVIYDQQGKMLDTWGDDVLDSPGSHGIFIDQEDNVYCSTIGQHCVFKFNSQGELVLTLGTPGQTGANDGDPFNRVTDVAVASNSDIFVSDGYGNARVHRYSAGGEHLLSWGEYGDGPGQFNISHCVRIDSQDRVCVCDRENNRLQIFDMEGNYLDQWTGLLQPNTVFFDSEEDVIYIAELAGQLSIYTLDGELVAKWGGGKSSQVAGEFIGGPHGMWIDSHGDLYLGEVMLGEHHRAQKYIRQR